MEPQSGQQREEDQIQRKPVPQDGYIDDCGALENHGGHLIRPRNITFDRYMLFTTKQSKGESIEHLCGKLEELSENCELRNQKDTFIRDLVIANMQDSEIQKELLKETVEPAQALLLAINMELGQRNQLQISYSQPVILMNAIKPQRQFRITVLSGRICGLTWSANHKDKCIAKSKKCNNCGLQNHFSRVCRKPKSVPSKPSRPNLISIVETTTDNSVNAIQKTNKITECGSDYDGSNDNMVASTASNTLQIEPKHKSGSPH